MLLKSTNGRYVDSGRVIGFAALGSDTTWFIRAYLTSSTNLEGSAATDLVQLAGTYTSESAAQAALAKLAGIIGAFDPADLA